MDNNFKMNSMLKCFILLQFVLIVCISCSEFPKEKDYTLAAFEIRDTVARMTDIIDGTIPKAVDGLIKNHPKIRIIIMKDVEGSSDDDDSLIAAQKIRRNGFHAQVPENGLIASGRTDFFIAGIKCTADNSAKIGVHSWADFFWFTLEAAQANDIHWMTI